MCSFGDLKFYSSRAFLDDVDDDDEETQSPPLVYTSLMSCEQPASSLLLAYGSLSVEFCRGLLPASGFQLCGRFCVGPLEVADVFQSPGLLLALCPPLRDAAPAFSLAQQLLQRCSGDSSCVVLTTEHICKLRAATGEFSESSEALRCLTSPAADRLPPSSVGRLPRPAFVDSVPAAVLTACTLQQLPCVTYVVYTETVSPYDVSAVAGDLRRALRSHQAWRKLSAASSNRSAGLNTEQQAGTPRKGASIQVPFNYI
ncbi:uncharacterized protein LOC108670301 [Hyalella azteca]|uniref:Proteasome assembly chaperone 1 n=1 Tax=Hyalella azteca TaxID=294128 RepID=A0A979FMI0_HYAAZ|nr:uncharacterized protein LOC108670301 [Hyalella azteca]